MKILYAALVLLVTILQSVKDYFARQSAKNSAEKSKQQYDAIEADPVGEFNEHFKSTNPVTSSDVPSGFDGTKSGGVQQSFNSTSSDENVSNPTSNLQQ